MKLTFQLERVEHLWAELEPLIAAHWRELGPYKDMEHDPDIAGYAAIEAAGALRVFTARAPHLVGYVAFFVNRHLHYRSSLQAVSDVLFLHPDYRRGIAGATLIRVAETHLRAEGVQVIYHHADRANRVGELLGRLGYDLIDLVYAKRLDKKKE